MVTGLPDAGARPRTHAFVLVGAAIAVAAGIALRLGSTSDLWLDDALRVNIARLPFYDMIDALRRDGHPPLYYIALHAWIELFGEGDEAVRSLSGVLALATLPVMWVAGRRYGGPRAGLIAL